MLRHSVLAKMVWMTLLILTLTDPLSARFGSEAMTYQEMFDKADLVVIATALATKDTNEQTKLLDRVQVIGVETEFATRATLKGTKNVRRFLLHHFRELEDRFTEDGPHLIYITPGRHPDFLMFLIKEKDGRYAPVTGQIDPASFSMLELKSGVPSEGLW